MVMLFLFLQCCRHVDMLRSLADIIFLIAFVNMAELQYQSKLQGNTAEFDDMLRLSYSAMHWVNGVDLRDNLYA